MWKKQSEFWITNLPQFTLEKTPELAPVMLELCINWKKLHIVTEVNHYKVSILGLQNKMKGAWKKFLNTYETMLFMGHTEANASHSKN